MRARTVGGATAAARSASAACTTSTAAFVCGTSLRKASAMMKARPSAPTSSGSPSCVTATALSARPATRAPSTTSAIRSARIGAISTILLVEALDHVFGQVIFRQREEHVVLVLLENDRVAGLRAHLLDDALELDDDRLGE